jgi:uncharacterized protein YfiM (DUF2279 family)
MNACFFALCLALSGHRTPPPGDRVFGEDKLQHFFVSVLATSLAAGTARAAGLDGDASLRIGAGAGLALGVAKELHDLNRPDETASLLDLAWDAAGVAAATALVAQTR